MNKALHIYEALIEQNIRNAWLYNLYLVRENFESVAATIYIIPCSSNVLVQMTIAHNLKVAAREELLRQSELIDQLDLFEQADIAFKSLESLLGDKDWFDGSNPGLFDCHIFSYTHLLLDEQLGWRNNTLPDQLRRHTRLVQHAQRMLERCLDNTSTG